MYTIMNDKITTTTIKIENSLYDEFKTLNIKRKFYLKDLVIRCMYLYVTDQQFRDRVYNFSVPVLSEAAQTTPITIVSGSSSLVDITINKE
jgi:hypothetical protein